MQIWFGVCSYTERATVAGDSNYEDEEDGWSVVEGGRACSFGACAEPVGRTEVASLGAPGRFGALVETIKEDILGDEFLIVLVTIQGFALLFWMSAGSDNRSDVLKRGGQQRKGRTARKRAAAAGTSVMRILGDGRVVRVQQSHEAQKRLCWLGAKLRRTIMSGVVECSNC